jgi:hypothetical protein
MTEPQITRSLEAYIMWLLSKVMFTENHQTTISRCYIPIAHEIADATTTEDITPRSWGSAVLASTYRGMCNGCKLTVARSGLLGCPLLLQLWSWERFCNIPSFNKRNKRRIQESKNQSQQKLFLII